jgi:hypothetical protein
MKKFPQKSPNNNITVEKIFPESNVNVGPVFPALFTLRTKERYTIGHLQPH